MKNTRGNEGKSSPLLPFNSAILQQFFTGPKCLELLVASSGREKHKFSIGKTSGEPRFQAYQWLGNFDFRFLTGRRGFDCATCFGV
jgi:hypothetical protein